jgi:hypothetical protein
MPPFIIGEARGPKEHSEDSELYKGKGGSESADGE